MRIPTMMVIIGLSLTSRSGAQTPPSTWTFGASVHENRQFDRLVNDEPTGQRIVDNGNVRFGYTTARERSRVSLFAHAGTSYPRKTDDDNERRNQINFGLGVGWNRSVTQHFDSTLRVNVSRNISRQLLSELGVVAPDLETRAANTSWETQYQAGPRTSLSTLVTYGFRDIRNGQAIPGSQIVLDQQPFGDDLTIPVPEPTDGDLQVPDAENDVLAILATEGLESDNRSHLASAGFGLSHDLSQRTTLGFNLMGGYRSLTRGRMLEGSVANGQFYARRSIGTTTSLNASYSVQRSLVLEPATTVQSAFGGVTTSGRETSLSFTATAGVSYFEAEGGLSRVSPVANLSLSGGLTSSTTGSVTYRRQFANAIGFGSTLLLDFFAAGLNQELGSRANVRLHVGASLAEDPLRPEFESNSKRAGGAFTIEIAGGLSAGTSLFWTDTESSDFALSSSTQQKMWTINLSYGTSWH